MKQRNPNRLVSHRFFYLFNFVLAIILAGCSVLGTQQPTVVSTTTAETPSPGAQVVTKAVITFQVTTPQIQAGQDLSLDVLDEVTGLALNPTRYKMTRQDDTHFTVALPVTIGSLVKYRYSRLQNAPTTEVATDGQPVRYRLYYVTSPAIAKDIVAAWNDHPYTGPTGRISGTIQESAQHTPLANILVEAGGVQNLTGSDGTFLLEGLPPGEHNLTVMAMDGAYQTVQQGALVAANATTPALFSMAPSQKVNVTFHLTVPQEAINVPVRIAGSLLEFGNTFADLAGGISDIASRMPVMSPDPKGGLTLTLALPEGAYIEYKYTLGDGFWNAEHTTAGDYKLRQLLVPNKDTIIDDTVETWKSPGATPITFNVKVPDETPASDYVSIQFNPFTWTEPIPMWSLGKNNWIYILFSPLNTANSFSYRYCRNDQCGSADDQATQGVQAKGWPVTPGNVAQTFQDQVKAWAWWTPSGQPTTVASVDLKPRPSTFMAGIEFQSAFDPSWQPKYLQALQNLHSGGSNWVIVTPSWTFSPSKQPILQPVAGADPLWPDLVETIGQARSIGLKAAVFPQPHFPMAVDQWWTSAPRDFSWWQAWFDRYQEFILNNADLAAKTGAEALILGGDWWLSPALPQGKLADGSPSGVPGDVEARWRQLISLVRTHYKGTLIWAISYPVGMKTPPPFLDAVDQVYVLFNASIASKNNPSEADLEQSIGADLDKDISPFSTTIKKPIVLGIDYPSINGSASDCVPASGVSTCLDVSVLDRPNPDLASATLDLQSQTSIYNAFMVAVNQRDWITGFISRGYYPPAALQDKSSSVHGKSAYDVLSYWFGQLKLNK